MMRLLLHSSASTGKRAVPCLLEYPRSWCAHTLRHAATVSKDPNEDCWDKITMKDMIFHGFHGVLKEERVLGQKFVIDATLSCSLRAAGLSDNLAHTINYAVVYEQIKSRVEGKPRQLIEALAEDIAAEILDSHPAVKEVLVAVRKPHVALPGVLGSTGVEITRRRENGNL